MVLVERDRQRRPGTARSRGYAQGLQSRNSPGLDVDGCGRAERCVLRVPGEHIGRLDLSHRCSTAIKMRRCTLSDRVHLEEMTEWG